MKAAIRHLDNRFKTLTPLISASRPPNGWLRAIRDALGMTAKQLADRIGVAQPRITEMEKAELTGNITLHSLQRAAEALGCQVVYALVPEQPLAKRVRQRAEYVASKKLAAVQQTMFLEDQSVRDSKTQKEMRDKMIQELLNKPSRLWNDK